MSDADGEFEFRGRQLLNKSKLNPLRERMREFVSEHESSTTLIELRRMASRGRDLSDVVVDNRDERL